MKNVDAADEDDADDERQEKRRYRRWGTIYYSRALKKFCLNGRFNKIEVKRSINFPFS